MQRLLCAIALLTIAAPASAVTLVANFNGADTAVASVTRSNGTLGVTVTAVRFQPTPNSLTNFSQTVAATGNVITRNIGGLGITGGGSPVQMDTNSAGTVATPLREGFLVTSTTAFALTALTLSAVDSDDTLQIYGVRDDGTLRNYTFGFGTSAANNAQARLDGAIIGGANGSLLNNARSAANGGTNSFGTGIQNLFTRYIITTRVGGDVTYLGTGGQGFALSGLEADPVPEPASWGMLLVGFGLVGLAARRRKAVATA